MISWCVVKRAFTKYHDPGAGWFPSEEERALFIERFGEDVGEELLSSEKPYTGKELKEKGLALPVLPQHEVDAYALEMARELAECTCASLIQLKRHLAQGIAHEVGKLRNALPPFGKEKLYVRKKEEKKKNGFQMNGEAPPGPGPLSIRIGSLNAQDVQSLVLVMEKLNRSKRIRSFLKRFSKHFAKP